MDKGLRKLWPKELSDRVVNLNKMEEKILQIKLQQIERERAEMERKKKREIFKIAYELEIKQAELEALDPKKNIQKAFNLLMKTIPKNKTFVENKDLFDTNVNATVFKKCYTDPVMLTNDHSIEITRSKSTDDLRNDANLKNPFMIEKINSQLELRPNSSNLEQISSKKKSCVIIKKKTFKF